jgi:hypothetical protein
MKLYLFTQCSTAVGKLIAGQDVVENEESNNILLEPVTAGSSLSPSIFPFSHFFANCISIAAHFPAYLSEPSTAQVLL